MPSPPRLPRVATAAVLLHGGPAEGPEGPLSVLVLADQPQVRHRLLESLRGAGHDAAAVGETVAAFNRLCREPCDAILAVFRPPAPPLLRFARELQAMPPMARIALVGLVPQSNQAQTRECLAAGFDLILSGEKRSEEVLAALGRAVSLRWGPGPLDTDLRATLATTMTPEAMEARDGAALEAAGRIALELRQPQAASQLREGAEAIAAALAPIGALAAPAAARALAAAPQQRNTLLPPLLSALVALRTALRREQGQRGPGGPISGGETPPPGPTKDPGP